MSSITMAADSTQSELRASIKKRKKKEKESSKKKRKLKKSSKRRKDESDSDTDCESDLDLSKELQPIGGYIRNREQTVEQMFRSIGGKKLKAMLPEILKAIPPDVLKRLCIEQLECMSKKRIRRILQGDDPETISSSGTDDDDDLPTEDEKSKGGSSVEESDPEISSTSNKPQDNDDDFDEEEVAAGDIVSDHSATPQPSASPLSQATRSPSRSFSRSRSRNTSRRSSWSSNYQDAAGSSGSAADSSSSEEEVVEEVVYEEIVLDEGEDLQDILEGQGRSLKAEDVVQESETNQGTETEDMEELQIIKSEDEAGTASDHGEDVISICSGEQETEITDNPDSREPGIGEQKEETMEVDNELDDNTSKKIDDQMKTNEETKLDKDKKSHETKLDKDQESHETKLDKDKKSHANVVSSVIQEDMSTIAKEKVDDVTIADEVMTEDKKGEKVESSGTELTKSVTDEHPNELSVSETVDSTSKVDASESSVSTSVVVSAEVDKCEEPNTIESLNTDDGKVESSKDSAAESSGLLDHDIEKTEQQDSQTADKEDQEHSPVAAIETSDAPENLSESANIPESTVIADKPTDTSENTEVATESKVENLSPITKESDVPNEGPPHGVELEEGEIEDSSSDDDRPLSAPQTDSDSSRSSASRGDRKSKHSRRRSDEKGYDRKSKKKKKKKVKIVKRIIKVIRRKAVTVGPAAKVAKIAEVDVKDVSSKGVPTGSIKGSKPTKSEAVTSATASSQKTSKTRTSTSTKSKTESQLEVKVKRESTIDKTSKTGKEMKLTEAKTETNSKTHGKEEAPKIRAKPKCPVNLKSEQPASKNLDKPEASTSRGKPATSRSKPKSETSRVKDAKSSGDHKTQTKPQASTSKDQSGQVKVKVQVQKRRVAPDGEPSTVEGDVSSLNQMEILELEMRARAIKAMLRKQEEMDKNPESKSKRIKLKRKALDS